jgi:hypothetical protein
VGKQNANKRNLLEIFSGFSSKQYLFGFDFRNISKGGISGNIQKNRNIGDRFLAS